MSERLNTQQLIQACRDNYDAAKLQERLQDLQITLQLRNKEVYALTAQLAANKQQTTTRIAILQSQATYFKKENAQLRVLTIRAKRSEAQKCEYTLQAMRKDYQQQIAQREAQFQRQCEEWRQQQKEDHQKMEEKYKQILKMEKNESQAYRSLCGDKTNTNEYIVNQIEQERTALLVAKRQADQKVQALKEALQHNKMEFKALIAEKDEQLIIKAAQIEGLKLQERLLRERIEDISSKQQRSYNQNRTALAQLKQTNARLTVEIEFCRELLKRKDEEILKELTPHFSNTHKDIPITAVHECNHINLIQQLERSLEIKDKEIEELRTVVENWGAAIGFNKSPTQRLEDISLKSSNVKEANSSFQKALRARTGRR